MTLSTVSSTATTRCSECVGSFHVVAHALMERVDVLCNHVDMLYNHVDVLYNHVRWQLGHVDGQPECGDA
ncbi:MAG: hypothetical protein IPM54_43480 [Polyangiaceae bacterium]|nr:hypothetical protein [Polyangiaceae bacterium]